MGDVRPLLVSYVDRAREWGIKSADYEERLGLLKNEGEGRI